MANIGLKIDPTGEDANNVVLNLNDGTIFKATETQFPTPDRDVAWASSADTEGALPANLRYQNRTITITCWVFGTSASVLQTNLGYLEQKIGKINSEGATLEYVSPSGQACIFDLLEGAADFATDVLAAAKNFTQVTITLTAKPFWRAGSSNRKELGRIVETTLPHAVVTNAAPAGDIPALGVLYVLEAEGKDQWTLLWGTQCRNYSSSANAELFYEAESREPKAGEKKAGPSGASGAGENTIFCGSLIPSYQPILSTRKASAGAHLSHVGTYRVFARIQRPTTNTGSVSVALEWNDANFLRPTVNAPRTYAADELEGAWTIADLGLVQLSKAQTGTTQQWEGRLLAKSTANGDDIYVDYLMLFPVDEGYGEIKTVPSPVTPTTVAAHDEFDQAEEKALAGLSLPLGGTWAAAKKGADATGFTVIPASHVARRTEVSDENLNKGSYAIAGSTKSAATKVAVDITTSTRATSTSERFGVFARFAEEGEEPKNWLMAVIAYRPQEAGYNKPPAGTYFEVLKRKEGTVTTLAQKRVTLAGGYSGFGSIPWTTTAIQVDANGNWQAWCYRAGTNPGSPLLIGSDTDLATGGKLAEGLNGFYDAWTQSAANTREYDNFAAFTGTAADAAVSASAPTVVWSDKVVSSATGATTYYQRRDYRGSYFNPPPAGREARTMRTIVKLCRGNIDTMADPAIDDVLVEVFAEARGLVIPES